MLDGVLLIISLLAGVVAIVTMIATVADRMLIDLPIGLPGQLAGGTLPAGTVLHEARGLVSVRTGLGYRLAWWLVGSGVSLLVLSGASLMHEIVTTARAGDPFVSANVRRLRLLGGLTVGFFVVTVAQSLLAGAIRDDLGLAPVALGVGFNPLAFALVLFGLAQIWQRGVELRDEQRLTV